MGSQATVAALEADHGDERWTFEFDGRGSVFALGDDLAILKTTHPGGDDPRPALWIRCSRYRTVPTRP